MSLQAAKDFITHANQDEAMRSIARERFLEIESVGSEHGFEFTREDFAQAMRERRGSGAVLHADQIHNCQCGRDKDDDDDKDTNNCQCGDDKGPSNCQCGDTEDDVPPSNCQCPPDADDDVPPSNCQCVPPPPPKHKK